MNVNVNYTTSQIKEIRETILQILAVDGEQATIQVALQSFADICKTGNIAIGSGATNVEQ